MDYDRWLQRFSTRMERIVFRLTMVIVVLLFIAQAVLLNDHIRPYLSYTDNFEGNEIVTDLQEVIAGKRGQGTVIGDREPALLLELIPAPDEAPPDLYLLVNGELYAPLGTEKVYIPVAPGDLLEVSGDVFGNSPAIVRIAEVYGNLQAPKKGTEVLTFGEKELIAWIIPEKIK